MEPFLKVELKRLDAENERVAEGGNEKRRAEADGAKNVRRRKRRRVAARRTTGRVANCVDKYSLNAEKNQLERRILSAFRRIFFEIFTRRRRNGANCVKCARKSRSAKCSARNAPTRKNALPSGERIVGNALRKSVAAGVETLARRYLTFGKRSFKSFSRSSTFGRTLTTFPSTSKRITRPAASRR